MALTTSLGLYGLGLIEMLGEPPNEPPLPSNAIVTRDGEPITDRDGNVIVWRSDD